MNYLYLSNFAAIIGTFSMLPIYLYLYYLYRERYVFLWIVSWVVFFSRIFFFDLEFIGWKNSTLGFIIYSLVYIFCAYLYTYANCLFVNKSLKKYWLYGAIVIAILSITATIMQMPMEYKLMPVTFFTCIALLHIGNVLIHIKTNGIGKYIIGVAMILWGIFTFAIPFYLQNNSPIWQISFICGILRPIIACGILLVYFEKTREDLISNQKSLQKVNLELQLSNNELNHFCHSVAHDFKSPLSSINKLLDYIIADYSDKIDHDGQDLLKKVQNKSVEIVNMTDHLLELSRMSKKKIEKVDIKLECLFKEVFDELISLQPVRQVLFNLNHLPNIKGDPIMIKILVLNIFSNSLKYTRNREQAIIDVDSVEKVNDYIISVKDNGAGFNMDDSDRLFKLFERLHSVDEFEGTGVGLVVCQKILKRHGGKAWLVGKKDEGAIFYFSFPKEIETIEKFAVN